MDELAKVKPDTMRFDELMVNIRNGKIRIPDFQREFVWELSQIIRLLDSIYHHYPIGSFLFWRTDDEIQAYRRVGEIELRQADENSVQYVLDGQQRITSLFASLEQASIAHRINGKKVTKSVQVYFDLDNNSFVANPFARKDATVIHKRTVFVAVPGTDDCLGFLNQFLSFIGAESPSRSRTLDWLMNWPEMAKTTAKRLRAQIRDMGFFEDSDDACLITERGSAFLANGSLESLVQILLERINYFSELLPKVLETGRAEFGETVEYLSQEMGEEIQPYKVSARLRWLAGIGLGNLNKTEFLLSNEGKATLEEVYRQIAIQERDRREQEEEKRKRYFSVRQITDLDRFVETAASLDSARREELQKVRRRFDSYPFSVIQVLEQPIETACEIFERINNSGKILNVVDLMVAKSWSTTFNLRERLNKFREELKRERYEEIPDITIIQCLASIVQRGVRRKDILDIERSAVEENWHSTLENIRQAIDFLKTNVKVANAKILPYNACLVPLTFYFSVADKKTHDNARRAELERWFWKASVSNRYDQAAESKLADDISEMANLAQGREAPFDYVAPALSAERISAQRLNLGSAFCKTLLCALNQRGPREFKDSAPVALTSFSKFNSAELHHIFPVAYLRKQDRENYPDRDSMANIALARASANKEYSSNAPSKYLAKCNNKILGEVLSSHLVEDPEKSGIFDDDFETFLEYRAERLLQELRKLTGEMTEIEADMADNELSVLERFELQLRDLIDSRLRAADSDYWEKTSTPEFRERIEQRIANWLKEAPGRARSDAREVDFFQMFDYLKVIKAHWSSFEGIFRSRGDLEQYLKILADFRNALAHNREVDTATRQLALGALAWFDKAFKAANATVD